MVGLIGFILVSLIGLDDLSITSLFGSSASSVLHLITLFILAGLSIYRPLKQAAHRAHGIAIKQSSATKIANAASTYYLIASLFHVHSLMREKMWWWLALARKRMWQWIASLGQFYDCDVLQYTKQAFSLRLPQMTKYCVMGECDNIHSWISTTGELNIYLVNSMEFTVLNSPNVGDSVSKLVRGFE
jgi:hypothetical protein